MTKDELHQRTDELFVGYKRRMLRCLVHALIDLGQITTMDCQWEFCVLPGVPFDPVGVKKTGVTLDHRVAINDGGSDRPENLQLLHHTCNMRKGVEHTAERRQKFSDAVRRRWADPVEGPKLRAATLAGIQTPEASTKKSVAMKAHWADPEKKAAHLTAMHKGGSWDAETQARRTASVQRSWNERRGISSC